METPLSINQWAEDTFGPRTALEAACRCNVELSELISACSNDADANHIAGEVADVYIVICQVPEIEGERLERLIQIIGKPMSGIEELSVFEMSLIANRHMANLMSILYTGPGGDTHGLYARQWMDEVVKVTRYLYAIAQKVGFNLHDEVDKKMKINRARTWRKTASGQFQHAS